MFHRGMLGEIIAAGDGVEILAEVLDQILDLVRQNLIRDFGEEDTEELEDVLVVERRPLIEQDGVYILQEPVAVNSNDYNDGRYSFCSHLSTRRSIAVLRVVRSMLREL